MFSYNFENHKFSKIFFNIIRLQSIFLIIVVIIFVSNVLPGSLSPKLYDSVMHNNANGYSLMKWANSKLPQDSIVLSTHSSVSLLNVKSCLFKSNSLKNDLI